MKRSVTAIMAILMSLIYTAIGDAQIVGTGQLNIQRRAHTATIVNDDKFLIVGGDNQNGFNAQSEIFVPVAQSASLAATLATARTDHRATVPGDGTILIVVGDTTGSAELYNPSTQSFSLVTSSLNTARRLME